MTAEYSSARLNSDSLQTANISDSSKIPYDVIVIGGGIVGTGIARDASMRGMSVALFEFEDLSSGTSSKSSRLIHGGLRYLDTYDFGLVYKDLHEREKLMRIAPHLIRPLKFIVPQYYQSSYQRFRLKIGMVLYDLLSTGKTVPSHQMVSAEEMLRIEPSLKKEGLQGGAVFYDCQAPFVERLSIENALSAVENGAKIFTHTRVVGCDFEKDDSNTVHVEDALSHQKHEFRTRCVIDATGPWSDSTFRTLTKRIRANRLRTTKGIHLVFPRLNENAIILYSKSDRRLFFVIPWLNYSLIGTTDSDYSDDPGNVKPDFDSVDYLVKAASEAIPGLSADDILFTYAGVRPLVRTKRGKKESSVSRNYRIIDRTKNKNVGFISVLGVKITSYRQAAEDASDLVGRKLKRFTKCSTATEPLPGGRGIVNYDEFVIVFSKKLSKYGLDEKQIRYLLSIYGSRVSELTDIIDSDSSYIKRICPNNPDIEAQIVLGVKKEFAQTVSDFMMRRTTIAFSSCRGLDCDETVANSMGKLLGWSDDLVRLEIESYRKNLDSRFPTNVRPSSGIG